MIRGRGGVAGDVENVRQVIAGIEGDGAEIQDGRDQHDAVDVNAVVLLQIISERGGTEGAVTFADEKFRGVPAIIAIEIDVDELREHFDVLVHAPEIFILGFGDGVAETSADGIDEHHIGFIEQGIGVVFDFVGRGRSGGVVGVDDAARAEGAHVQPDGRGAGTTVVDEGDGTLREIFDVAARVGGGIDQRGRLAFFVFQQGGGGGGFVGDGLTVDSDGVIGDPRFFFRRVGVGDLSGDLASAAAGFASFLVLALRGAEIGRRAEAVLPHRYRGNSSFALRSGELAPQLSPQGFYAVGLMQVKLECAGFYFLQRDSPRRRGGSRENLRQKQRRARFDEPEPALQDQRQRSKRDACLPAGTPAMEGSGTR